MFIVGVDPGLVNTGWTIIDFDLNQKSKIIDYGLIITNSQEKISFRLAKIFDELSKNLDKYKVDSASLEKTLVNKNAKSSMDLSMARSIILLYFGQRNLDYREYLPTFIKKSIAGNGKADKEQLRTILPNYLQSQRSEHGENEHNLKNLPHHIIDSISIAICHGFAMNNILSVY
jgi:crossover junction endodeoxyribonuclease RuvC